MEKAEQKKRKKKKKEEDSCEWKINHELEIEEMVLEADSAGLLKHSSLLHNHGLMPRRLLWRQKISYPKYASLLFVNLTFWPRIFSNHFYALKWCWLSFQYLTIIPIFDCHSNILLHSTHWFRDFVSSTWKVAHRN